MKKFTLGIMLAAALALTACGGKNTENVQTEAASTEQAQAETNADGSVEYSSASLPEEYDQEVYEGIVTDYTGDFMSVEGTDGVRKFDLSGADLSEQEDPIVRGCEVEVTYADKADGDTYPADGCTLLNDNEQLAQEEERDPYIYGKLRVMDVNDLEMIDDAGRTIDFDNSISRTVAFSDLKEGDEIIVTYAGSINAADDGADSNDLFSSTPVAIKIVAADAAKTEDAEANYIDGTVSGIDGDTIILSTELSDFECTADESIISDVSEETHIRVYYTGSLASRALSVDKIEHLD